MQTEYIFLFNQDNKQTNCHRTSRINNDVQPFNKQFLFVFHLTTLTFFWHFSKISLKCFTLEPKYFEI